MDERDNRRPSYDGLLTKALDPLAFRADAAKGALSGYLSKWWVVDSYGEFTVPGCFAKSIAERGPAGANRIVLRYEHEYTVGVFTTLREDDAGLYCEAQISDDGMYGSLLRRQLADGVPYGMSIGFRRVAQRDAFPDDPLDMTSAPRWVAEAAVQDPSLLTGLTEVKLLEGSTVTFPAVDPAMVESYRSDDLNARALRRVLADLKAGRLTDAHLALLTDIVAALPADVAPDGQREAGRTTRAADGTSHRNFRAEHALLLARLGAGV